MEEMEDKESDLDRMRDNQQDKQSHDHDNQQDHDHDSQQDHDKPNNDLPDERHTSSHLPTVQTSSSEDIETSDSLDETKELEQKKLKEAEDDEREQNRLTAMNELKEIEIDFAHLKDKLYETQLKKLEFELKLCEMNKHPDFVYFMKMIDENFKGRIERSINLQKNRLRCLDNQTRAYRVQIHQQFIKNCEDLKYREIRRITSDWYEINKERRTMDTASLQSPEYYQYNEHITAKNVEEQGTINELVRQRNALYREISNMEGMVKYKRVFPSSLNYIKGCDDEEMEVDLREMTS
ncbi:DEKNAAC103273 [Brettanomyces naardenensis]|uniref:DEKNAAC103274 n=1 Tax=Brettanomyces naardenensis TaxID=13370 RepID=A0A448YMZ9_BRENA|nr:DEKNAAC103273 [Brettanomyces naardenensis]